jgi:ferrous iron transport protein A
MGSDVPIPLTELPSGTQAVVRRITGGRELGGRLAAMGITVGSSLEVLQNSLHGPLLVRVRITRFALGRGKADKVLVEKVDA